MELNIKECPFCGGEVKRNWLAGTTMFSCLDCRATVSFRGKEVKQATEAFNRRDGVND